MSAKPPILPLKPIAGLTSSTKPQVPSSSPVKEVAASPSANTNTTSSTGDVLLESREFMLGVVPRRHLMKLFERTDPAQFFPFLAQCSCGFEARTKEEVSIRSAASQHIKAHSV